MLYSLGFSFLDDVLCAFLYGGLYLIFKLRGGLKSVRLLAYTFKSFKVQTIWIASSTSFSGTGDLSCMLGNYFHELGGVAGLFATWIRWSSGTFWIRR